jgi:molybdopterin converting factor small subunit
MISLSIRFEPPFNELTKKLHEKLEFDRDLTLNQLLDYFYEKYGEEFRDLIWDKHKKGELSSFLSIIINGRTYRSDSFLETLLRDGDDLAFLYIYFGG